MPLTVIVMAMTILFRTARAKRQRRTGVEWRAIVDSISAGLQKSMKPTRIAHFRVHHGWPRPSSCSRPALSPSGRAARHRWTGRSTTWIWPAAGFRRWTRSTRRTSKSLTPRWLFQHGVIDGVSNQTTPVIVDGRDVRDRFARQRLRGRRRRRPSALDLRRDQSHWRRSAGRLRVPQPRRRATRTAWSTRRRARSCSRSTPRPGSRFQASARTARPA